MVQASSRVLAELSDELGTSGTLDDAATAGDELFGVAAVLRREPALRRVATDASVEADAKAGLVEGVFGGQVSARTLKVLQAAVARRWTVASDLPRAVEHVGVVATVRSAGAKGRDLADELFAVKRLVNGDRGLRGALADPTRTDEDKAAMLTGLLGDRVMPATQRLVREALQGAEGTFARALDEYERIAADAQSEMLAVVHTARPLTDGESERLSTALGRQYGTDVHLQVLVDPDLVGGLRVEIADDVIDGTVTGRLDDARRKLVG